MASSINTIHVKRQRGKLVVQGDGRTVKGKRYIVQTVELTAKTPADPNFKSELAAAVAQLNTTKLATP